MVELIVNGKQIELEDKGNEIKYTKQIADILDIASILSSYTNSFKIPKTPNNTQTFEMLGIVGDTSNFPYSKNSAQLNNQGFPIVNDGLLNITETNESYKASIVDGIVEVFKDLANKTMGVDLDLKNFNHQKNIANVANSVSNEYYRYQVADFGGKTVVVTGAIPIKYAINIDYLTPSFSVVKLLELIFQTFGYSINYTGLQPFINDLWITYPLPPEINSSDFILSSDLKKNSFITTYEKQGSIYRVPDALKSWDIGISTINEGTVLIDKYTIPTTSVYNFNLKVKGYALYKDIFNNSYFGKLKASVIINGVNASTIETDPYTTIEGSFNYYVEQGSIVEVNYYVEKSVLDAGVYDFVLRDFHFETTELVVSRVSNENVSLSNAMKSFKITDFLKEIIWRTATIPYFDDNKTVNFLKVNDRLKISEAINWSDKFVQRTSEKYIRSSYAQKNRFKMKYNVENADYADGFINVNNQNLEDEKILAVSQIYAPEKGVTKIIAKNSSFRYDVPILTMWQKEQKFQDEEIVIEYKALDNRYYFTRSELINQTFTLKSYETPGQQDVSSIYISNIENTTFAQTMPSAFAQYEKIFNNFRSHQIELALSLKDFLLLDLKKMYYFEQESKYYFINNITFQEGELSKAECVAVIPL